MNSGASHVSWIEVGIGEAMRFRGADGVASVAIGESAIYRHMTVSTTYGRPCVRLYLVAG